MRVAFFSPLPPSRSGTADYSETLLEHLKPLAEVEVFSDGKRAFDPPDFDIALYHLGNNAFHGFVYEAALRHPGVVVMHESNLHHLITEITIRRNDWDGYLRACEYEGGPAALAFAKRVKALEVGPDYEGLRMTRRVLESAKAAIVHSEFMVDEVRTAGFAGPVARIPHGAWIPDADRNAWRFRLGIDEATPLIGVFGFLKPYKRIAESLRAFRRLLRVAPAAKMILVGEPHPEFPLEPLIRTFGIIGGRAGDGFYADRGFHGLHVGLRHRAQSAVSHRGREFRQPAARAGIGQSGASVEDRRIRGISRRCLSEGARRGGRGRPDLRVSESAGVAAGGGASAGSTGGAVRGGRVQLGPGGRVVCVVSWVGSGGAHMGIAGEGRGCGCARFASGKRGIYIQLGGRCRCAGVRRYASDAAGKNARDDARGWPGRPHSGDGRLSADHAGAEDQAGLRTGARLLLRAARKGRPAQRDFGGGRDVRLRNRSVQCREGPLPLSRTDTFRRCYAAN